MEHWAGDDDYDRETPDVLLMRRMLGYVTRHRRKSLTLFAVLLVSTVVSLLPPYMISLAIDEYITKLDTEGLLLIGGAFVVVYILIFVTQYANRYLIEWLGSRLEYDLRMDMFRHLQQLGLGFYAKQEVGNVVSRATNDVEKITELVSTGIASVIADLFTLLGIILIMLYMNWWLSLITFSIIPVMFLFLFLWGKRVRKVYRETRKTIASVSAKMEESVSGMKEIQSFSRESQTREEFQQVNRNNMDANVQAGQVMSAFWPAVNVFTAVGNFLVLWFGGAAVMRGELSVGILFGFMNYVNRFFTPVQDLSMFWNQVQSALAAA